MDFEPIINNEDKPVIKKRGLRIVSKLFLILLFLIIVFGFKYLFNYVQLPPTDFPVNSQIIVPAGSTVQDVAKLVKDNNIVKSELAFFAYFTIFHDPSSVKASTYSFSQPLTLMQVAEELVKGNYSEGLIKFTHIEGERVEKIADQAIKILPKFDEAKFINLAKPHEGRLFPETYMIPVTYDEQKLLDLLLNTFSEKIKPLEAQIAGQKLTLDEVVILASIIEREANSKESKQIISGIIQNRLDNGMPLQLDASIEYILDKPLAELTAEDLKIDSPYNTYSHNGLPPTAIGNPGLEAIEAVLIPTKTDYLFYITGDDGNFYYAEDFDEHRKNIAKYLRK